MSLNWGWYLSEWYFETDIWKDFSKGTCRWLYASDNGDLSDEYNSTYILLTCKPSPDIKAMIRNFEDANKDKSDLMMRDFYAHFSFDHTEIGRSAHADSVSNINVSTEEIFRRNAAHLYIRNSEELAPSKSYNPELIRKAARREGSFDEMISNFEDWNKGIQDLKMSNFYTYFWYDDFKEKFSSVNISNLIHNALAIVKPADRKNPCFHLYKKGLTPDMSYDGKKIRMMFVGARLWNNISILDEFEKINKENDNLTMGDLYNFTDFIYKYPVGKIFSKMTSNLRLDIKSQIKNIQNNTGKWIDIRNIPLNLSFPTKSAFIYLIAISLWLYSTDWNKISDFDIAGKHQNVLKKYSASIDDIYNSWIEITDLDFLASLNNESVSIDDIRKFQGSIMSLLDDLKWIDLESQEFEDIQSDTELILKSYTHLFDTSDTVNIIALIEDFWLQNQKLDTFIQSLLEFYQLLKQQELKNPSDKNRYIEPILFWREENNIDEDGLHQKHMPHIPEELDINLEQNENLSQTIEIFFDDQNNPLIKT